MAQPIGGTLRQRSNAYHGVSRPYHERNIYACHRLLSHAQRQVVNQPSAIGVKGETDGLPSERIEIDRETLRIDDVAGHR